MFEVFFEELQVERNLHQQLHDQGETPLFGTPLKWYTGCRSLDSDRLLSGVSGRMIVANVLLPLLFDEIVHAFQ